MKMKSFYEILGVANDASDEDIKKAYKQMALKYHPDKSRTRNAEDRFKQIGRAYEVLADNKKREIYDILGEDGLMIEEGGNDGDDSRLEKSYSVSLEEISTTPKPRATSKKRVGPRNEKLSASQEIPTTRKRRTEKKVAASARDDSSTATAPTTKRKRSKSRTRRKSCDVVDASSKVVAKIKPQLASRDTSSMKSSSQSHHDELEMKNSSSAFMKVIVIIFLVLAIINLLKNIIYGLMLLVQVALNVAVIAVLYFVLTGRMADFYHSAQYFASNFWTISSDLMLKIIQVILRR